MDNNEGAENASGARTDASAMALVYAGKPGEAKVQLARARQLDLTPSEKSELVRLGHV